MRNIQTHKNEIDSSNLSRQIQSLSPSWLKSIVLLHFVGYGILLLVFFDLIEIFYPLNLFNSVWEFEVFGQLVERVVKPL